MPSAAPSFFIALNALASSPRWPLLFIHHGWGGGIARHIGDLERLLSDRCEIVHLTPEKPGIFNSRVRLGWRREGKHFDGVFTLPQEMPRLVEALKTIGIVRVHLHHIHALPPEVLTLPQALGTPLDVTLHDYFVLGNQYHLADHHGRFEGEPQADEGQQESGSAASGVSDEAASETSRWPITTAEWRALFGDVLRRADRVIAPSRDIAERVQRILPESFSTSSPLIWPHPEALTLPPSRLRVAALGALSPEKGFNLVCACARDAEARNLPLSFRILGTTAQPLPELQLSRLSMSGEYDEADLPALLAAEKPDVFFFPAQVPESFCYALTPALLSGKPIVASKLGALAERLRETPRAVLLPWDSEAAEWNEALCRFAPKISTAPASCETEAAYRQRYLEALPAELRPARSVEITVGSNGWSEPPKDKSEEKSENKSDDGESVDVFAELFDLYHAGVGCGRKEARAELRRRLKALRDAPPPPPPPPPAPDWWLAWLERKATWRQRRLRVAQMARNALYIFQTAGLRGVAKHSYKKITRRNTAWMMPFAPQAQETQITPLTVASSPAPQVSILIAAYGEPLATFSCIKSVHENTQDIAYEVLVLDDASPEPLQTQLAGVEGVRFIRQPKNLGFLKNCNEGAKEARGEILVFLNNDTLVTEGWLTALVDTLDQTPDAGLVGAQLCYPDGRLQEAGGIVFNDGSAWNYGRNDDPNRPEFHYCRDVDYCSGACIALPRTLWEQLGGFDERFAPAYYEDTDLAFQVRAAGKRVLYQPLARVIHFEGQTSGTDETQGVKRYQVINQTTFLDKWHVVLAQQPERYGDIRRAAEHAAHTRILMLDACMLTPDRDSGSLRMWHLLRLLAKSGRKVTFAAVSLEYRAPYVGQLQADGVEVLHLPYFNSIETFLQSRASEYDVIVLSRLEVAARWLSAVRKWAPRTFVVYDTVDLHFLRTEREAEVLDSAATRAQAETQRKQELQLIRAADRAWVVSPVEQSLLAPLLPGKKIALLSNIHEPKPDGLTFGERAGLLFIGSFRHPPNVDAMLWYGREVLPWLRQLLPGVVTTIIGGDLPASVKALAADDVIVTGYIEDIEPYFAATRVSIAPLRYGAGVKGKVNQAMSYGVPVVVTTMAAEGMRLTDGLDALIADDAQAFAEAIARVYQDETLWRQLSAAGRDNIQTHFSREVAARELEKTLEMAQRVSGN
ncbi:MAG: glycosyltransferase [Burkholderiales bacterium]|jgi:GT2 family glycosyltransferase/glycosyltransferase involved in cell wall biosynthesis|nr:glycosyltransferase [Burkholderiales bacterium]